MNRSTLIMGSIFILTISFVMFIHFSNDHIECDTIVTRELDTNGNKVTVEEHVCKENYSF